MANIQVRRRGGSDDNPSWQLRVRLKGKDFYRTVTGCTPAAAEAAGRAFAEEHPEASPYTPAMMFRAYAEVWVTSHLPTLAGQTAVSYRGVLLNHILPAIGDKRIGRITAADGLRLRDRLAKAKLSIPTIRHILRLGRAILSDAQEHGVIPTNPWLTVRQKPKKRPRQEVLDPSRFHELAHGKRDDLQQIMMFALQTGMRVSEILALRWRDIAPEYDSLEVNGSLQTVLKEVSRKSPKTESGYRRIDLMPGTSLMLRARYMRAGRRGGDHPVFEKPGGGWMKPNSVLANARKRLRKAGLVNSMHALRHAHATALLSAGVPAQAVAQHLGHSDVRTTIAVYGHVLPRDRQRIVGVLSSAFAA